MLWNDFVKTELQLKRVRAATNALMALKKNPTAAPLLKGLPILGALREAERRAQAFRYDLLSDPVCAEMLKRTADSLDKLLP